MIASAELVPAVRVRPEARRDQREHLQRPVMPVEPTDGSLKCKPAIECRTAGIGMRQCLGACDAPENVWKLGLQEGEL